MAAYPGDDRVAVYVTCASHGAAGFDGRVRTFDDKTLGAIAVERFEDWQAVQ